MPQNVYRITLTRIAKLSTYGGTTTKITEEIFDVPSYIISENVLGLTILNPVNEVYGYKAIPLYQIIDMTIERIDGKEMEVLRKWN